MRQCDCGQSDVLNCSGSRLETPHTIRPERWQSAGGHTPQGHRLPYKHSRHFQYFYKQPRLLLSGLFWAVQPAVACPDKTQSEWAASPSDHDARGEMLFGFMGPSNQGK